MSDIVPNNREQSDIRQPNPANVRRRSLGNTGRMRTRSVVVVFGALTALFASGYGVMFTVLDEFRDQYGISEGALGLIVAMGFLSSFLAQVTLAPLADRGHARLMIVIGMVFNVAGLLGMAFGTTFIVLVDIAVRDGRRCRTGRIRRRGGS